MNKVAINESMLESIVWIAIMQKERGEETEDIIEFIKKIVLKKS